ncbi:hypothetical protein [Sphingomonas sp. 8AM]|uniref:hypothetical protein n=1 Tax=Sphingomonas sp. 8AM TaxID=2653170 RepID=UPI0012F1FD85|nr:hypothetical protein [Sphingomonas sp. 8AM]VXC82037.1 conserved hypothetical protein [Sphingomonas sp. 8AM]
MVDFTQDERLQITQALADGLSDQAGADAPALVGDARQIFCQNWDVVKQVLSFLKPYLPAPIGWVIAGLIAAGDILHGKIC